MTTESNAFYSSCAAAEIKSKTKKSGLFQCDLYEA